MQDRPTAEELLEAVSEFLEHDVTTLDGRVGYLGRVARNAVEIVRHELDQDPATDGRQREGLARLLGTDPPEDLAEAEAELARRIRDGSLDHRRSEVLAHVRSTTRAKLQIANPRELELWDATAAPATPHQSDQGARP